MVTQVGGEHYMTDGEQHWDRIYRLYGRGYFVGCATKYIERYHLKNGVEDIDKAISFLQKLKELEYGVQLELEYDVKSEIKSFQYKRDLRFREFD